jgi:hypothetical protein
MMAATATNRLLNLTCNTSSSFAMPLLLSSEE